jgi:hypothetical protein
VSGVQAPVLGAFCQALLPAAIPESNGAHRTTYLCRQISATMERRTSRFGGRATEAGLSFPTVRPVLTPQRNGALHPMRRFRLSPGFSAHSHEPGVKWMAATSQTGRIPNPTQIASIGCCGIVGRYYFSDCKIPVIADMGISVCIPHRMLV